jgi:hypothetical protein
MGAKFHIPLLGTPPELAVAVSQVQWFQGRFRQSSGQQTTVAVGARDPGTAMQILPMFHGTTI